MGEPLQRCETFGVYGVVGVRKVIENIKKTRKFQLAELGETCLYPAETRKEKVSRKNAQVSIKVSHKNPGPKRI